MRVLVWGLGYVGTVVAACLVKSGHEVIGVELNPEKVAAFNRGQNPLREPGLDELIYEGIQTGRLKAVTSGTEHVAWADMSLVCVGTPSAPDGSQVMYYIESVAEDIGKGMSQSDNYHVVVLRSTVFPGTSRNLMLPLLERYSGKRVGEDFGVAINPEFLREATAIDDFYYPPYTVIGEYDARSGDMVAKLYDGIEAPLHRIGLEEAELLKMTCNAFHAMKVGFANEIGRISSRIGLDSHVVMKLICEDTKLNISPAYLKPGFAFGGSCLPKDVRSLVFNANRLGTEVPILSGCLNSNEVHIESARLKVHDLRARKVAILGLSFKPGTDDVRESPVIGLIRSLWRDGMNITVYDPDLDLAKMIGSNREYIERQLPQIHQIMRSSLDEAMMGAQAVIITQKRPEFVALAEKLTTAQVLVGSNLSSREAEPTVGVLYTFRL